MATKKEAQQKAFDNYMKFIALCQLLFGKSQINSVNELTPDSPYYESAKSIVEEFELDWDNLSPEDNNEVMLTLLDDHFNAINIDKQYNYNIQLTVSEKKETKEKAE